MPRKTCTRRRRRLLRALGRLEEGCELPEIVRAEVLEARHRRAGVDAGRALEVVDLELDPLLLRAFVRQVRSARKAAARPQIAMAVQTADLGEDLRARNRVRGEGFPLLPLRHG